MKAKNPEILNEEVVKLVYAFKKFEEAVYDGSHGKTASFYMKFIKLLDYYFLFSRSIRTGDFHLLLYILPKLGNIFFALNQPNYARWLTKWHDDMLNVDKTHPGLKSNFLSGSFNIKRATKDFSAQPMDYVLETTHNADAANHKIGTTRMSTNYGGRISWSIGYSARAFVNSFIYDKCDINKKQDVTSDLQNSNIKRSVTQIEKIINSFHKHLNPFSEELNREKLFNICSGRSASEAVANFLLELEITGSNCRESYIKEFSKNGKRFMESIKQNKVCTFSVGTKKR